MIFNSTNLSGVYVIDLDKKIDDRGFFSRTWDVNIFKTQGLNLHFVQANTSISHKKGTLRGLHYQLSPFGEAKTIRCVRGSIIDVYIDLRPESSTYLKWQTTKLSERNFKILYIPEGFAHGFQTLEDDTEVTYQVSQFYNPEAERGIRYNDPTFNIQWPLEISNISKKDIEWDNFKP